MRSSDAARRHVLQSLFVSLRNDWCCGTCRAGDEVVITSRTILGARAVAASLQAEVGPGVRVQARYRPCRMITDLLL